MMSVAMETFFFLGVGKGIRNCYILLDKKEQCLLILKISHLMWSSVEGLGVFSLLEKHIYGLNIKKEAFSGMRLCL